MKEVRDKQGQSLAEFALILLVLLMLIFVIIDGGRLMWAYVTIQNAARQGARYASTGRTDCPAGTRLECIIEETHGVLEALPLNEDPNREYEDENYYWIEVWGVNDNGDFVYEFPGVPGKHVMVRVMYRVSILTPLLRPIQESLVLNGQVTLLNENFDSLGGAGVGIGLPPPAPPFSTAGPTPTPSETPSPGVPTNTATNTPTTAPPPCNTQFDTFLIEGQVQVFVTGEIGTHVTLYDLSVGPDPVVIGTTPPDTPLYASQGHACPGFGIITVNPALISNHVIWAANNTDGTEDTAIVLPLPPTNTPTPSPTALPSSTPTSTPSATPSATPGTPFITVFPSCAAGPTVNLTIEGNNWPTSVPIALFWGVSGQPGGQLITSIAAPHPAYFSYSWSRPSTFAGNYVIRAIAGSTTKEAPFTVPCPDAPTVTPTPATPTPEPPDLIIGRPELLSTPPIVEYQPLEFRVVISNTGDVEVSSQFFTDVFFDPPPTAIFSDTIDLAYSGGYLAVSSMQPNASRVLTITSPLGFTGGLTVTRTVYGVVDSILQIPEGNEYNNISEPLYVADVTPAASPTPPDQGDPNKISGIVRAFIGSSWIPQFRAVVYLTLANTTTIMGITDTNANGYYQFTNVPPGTYDVHACIGIDEFTYAGSRLTVGPPNPFVDVFMIQAPGGCPVP